MDREAAVIRSEMNQTLADLEHKLTRLEARMREMTPRRYAQRVLPEYWLDRAIGGLLTLIGARMVWRQIGLGPTRRAHIRAGAESYARW